MVFIKGPALRKMKSVDVPITLFDSNERSRLLSRVLALLFNVQFWGLALCDVMGSTDLSQVVSGNSARTHPFRLPASRLVFVALWKVQQDRFQQDVMKGASAFIGPAVEKLKEPQ